MPDSSVTHWLHVSSGEGALPPFSAGRSHSQHGPKTFGKVAAIRQCPVLGTHKSARNKAVKMRTWRMGGQFGEVGFDVKVQTLGVILFASKSSSGERPEFGPAVVGAQDAKLGHALRVGWGPGGSGDFEPRLEHMLVAGLERDVVVAIFD